MGPEIFDKLKQAPLKHSFSDGKTFQARAASPGQRPVGVRGVQPVSSLVQIFVMTRLIKVVCLSLEWRETVSLPEGSFSLSVSPEAVTLSWCW